MSNDDPTIPSDVPHDPGSSTAPGASGDAPGVVEAARSDFPEGYEKGEELGRGGMGVVFRAHETELARDVAVKLLRDEFDADSDTATRFLEEARVTAQLQHPGIPPIHRVGRLPNRRPYLVMKLIKGETLKALLEARTRHGTDRAQLVTVFEGVAQAVAYAHQRRVIHRDLKPGNVMVGAFGEVQVMDWGLAKVLAQADRSGPASESTISEFTVINSPRGTTVDGTQDGTVQGTPAFMPPEQAAGEIEKLGPRSDVFALGAVLCCILTGQPPYVGKTIREIHLKAIRGQTADALARLDSCLADAELVALAKSCLAADPAGRPEHAGEVVAALAGWRTTAAERARQAELERAAKRAAEAARDRAKQLYLLALAAFDQIVFDIHSKLENRPGTLELQQELLASARAGLQQLVGEAEKHGTPDRTLVWSHFRMGGVEQLLGNLEVARDEYRAGHELARRLAGEEPANAQARRDLSISLERLGNVALQQGDATAALRYYEEAGDISQQLADADPESAQARRDLSISLEKLGNAALVLGRAAEALAFYERSTALAERLASEGGPAGASAERDLAISLNNLGNVTLKLDRVEDALALYERSNQITERLAAADPANVQTQRDLGVCAEKLGDVGLRLGRTGDALVFYTRSLDITRRLADADPRDAQSQRDLLVSCFKLGNFMQEAGDLASAATRYAEAIDVVRRFARPEFFADELRILEGRLAACKGETAGSPQENPRPNPKRKQTRGRG